MAYFVIKADRDLKGAAQIEEHPKAVRDVIKSYKFSKGVALAGQFPQLPGYQMSDEYPDNRLLTDFQDNTDDLLIISQAFADIVKSLPHGQMEFLPIKIINHRNKVASDSYYLLNIIGTVDCLDLEKSTYKQSAMDADEIFSIQNMVLLEDRIPENTSIYRLHRMPTLFLVSEPLKNAVVEAGLTGIRFIPTDQFSGT